MGTPVLGICFGAQLLAAAIGGRVVRSEQPEFGASWVGVGQDWPVADGPWFHWHSDRVELPAGVQVLAQNQACVQAFTVPGAVGVQFHPEVDVKLLSEWVAVARSEDPGTDQPLDQMLAQWREHGPQAAANLPALMDDVLARLLVS